MGSRLDSGTAPATVTGDDLGKTTGAHGLWEGPRED
jgi:hypothetical protein